MRLAQISLRAEDLAWGQREMKAKMLYDAQVVLLVQFC